MRAKASIPAWAKYAIALAIVAGAFALFMAAPWRRPSGEMCTSLRANIEIVRTGRQSRRVSDTFIFENVEDGARVPTIAIERGDFQSNLTLPELRSCLGRGWVEVHAQTLGVDIGDGWVFVRAGEPRVLLVQSRGAGYSHVKWQIVVERTP